MILRRFLINFEKLNLDMILISPFFFYPHHTSTNMWWILTKNPSCRHQQMPIGSARVDRPQCGPIALSAGPSSPMRGSISKTGGSSSGGESISGGIMRGRVLNTGTSPNISGDRPKCKWVVGSAGKGVLKWAGVGGGEPYNVSLLVQANLNGRGAGRMRH